MKNSLKKLMASATAVAIVTMNMASMTVNAAAINNATAVVTPATNVVVTSAGAFAGSATCTATITRTNTDGTTSVVTLDSCTVEANTDDLTLAASTIAANEYYTIAFNTNDGVFGSVAVGDTTNNVVVTATVVPTLTMSLSAPTMALGTLGTAAYATAAVDVVTTTNAVGGADVTMASVGLKDTVVDAEIGVTDIAVGTAQTAATDYYKVSTNGTPTLSEANVGIADVGGTDMLDSQVVLNGTTPTDSSVTTKVTVGSKIGATTEAGNYTDTLTFTVTGSF